MRLFLFAVLVLFLANCRESKNKITTEQRAVGDVPDFTAFNKVDSVNPVLVPDTTMLFTCPIINKQVKWEEKDVFNPAAVVRHDTLFLLYRAEDMIRKLASFRKV